LLQSLQIQYGGRIILLKPSLDGKPVEAKVNLVWRVDDLGKRKFVAVLHQDPVNSPEDAVKAFIVSEYKKSNGL